MDEPLRVVAVIPGVDSGSCMIFIRRQVESLRRAGIDVRAFYLSSRTSPVRVWKEWRRLRALIKDIQPHILHAEYGTVTAAVCALATTAPLVITFRGADLNHDPDTSFIRFAMGYVFSQLSALRSSKLICVSTRLQQKLLWRKRSTMVLTDGLNMDLFRPQPKELCRDSLGWDRNERIVLFNAGTEPRTKGLDIVRAAVEVAQQKIGPVRLVVTACDVPPDRMPLYINSADCVVLASCKEGSPNIVKEALACNVPVVGVDVGDVPERLRGVHPSRIVEREPYQIGCALAEILMLGKRSNGREMVQECSETKIAEILAGLYGSIAGAQSDRKLPQPEQSQAVGAAPLADLDGLSSDYAGPEHDNVA